MSESVWAEKQEHKRVVSKMSSELKAMSALDRALSKINEAGDMAETLVSFAEKRIQQIKSQLVK